MWCIFYWLLLFGAIGVISNISPWIWNSIILTHHLAEKGIAFSFGVIPQTPWWNLLLVPVVALLMFLIFRKGKEWFKKRESGVFFLLLSIGSTLVFAIMSFAVIRWGSVNPGNILALVSFGIVILCLSLVYACIEPVYAWSSAVGIILANLILAGGLPLGIILLAVSFIGSAIGVLGTWAVKKLIAIEFWPKVKTAFIFQNANA